MLGKIHILNVKSEMAVKDEVQTSNLLQEDSRESR